MNIGRKKIQPSLLKFSKKGLVLAHLNICSLRNKVEEITTLCQSENIHILALTETHLDDSFDNSVVAVDGYNLYRRDRDKHGGGVALYIKDSIVVVQRNYIMCVDVEILWIQINIPHSKHFLVGCCYRPPSAHVSYLDKICEIVDRVSECLKTLFF